MPIHWNDPNWNKEQEALASRHMPCKLCGRPGCQRGTFARPYQDAQCYEIAYVRLVEFLREVEPKHLSIRARNFLESIKPPPGSVP